MSDQELNDLRPPKDTPIETNPPPVPYSAALPDLAFTAREFGKYLRSLPQKSAISSHAWKLIYGHFPVARQLLATHGKLCGLVQQFPYHYLADNAHDSTCVLSLNSDHVEHLM